MGAAWFILVAFILCTVFLLGVTAEWLWITWRHH